MGQTSKARIYAVQHQLADASQEILVMSSTMPNRPQFEMLNLTAEKGDRQSC
jgi:hypothetical protein